MTLRGRKALRDGLAVALIAVVGALVVRIASANPNDHLHWQVLGQITGIDFGDWPGIFYTGGGGDGEIFATLAADPIGRGPAQLILIPVYRYMRIGFSWAGWLVSFGQEEWVLPALFAVGLSSVAALGFVSGVLQDRLGPRALFLVANPALYLGFAGDSAEPLGLLFLTLAMMGSGLWAALALGATRPTYALALLGRWPSFVSAMTAAIAVRVIAALIFSASVFQGAEGAFAPPLRSFFDHPSVVGFAVLIAGLVTLVIGVSRRDLAWAVAGVLVVLLGDSVLASPLNAVRAAGMMPVLWAFGPSWRPAKKSGTPGPST